MNNCSSSHYTPKLSDDNPQVSPAPAPKPQPEQLIHDNSKQAVLHQIVNSMVVEGEIWDIRYPDPQVYYNNLLEGCAGTVYTFPPTNEERNSRF